MTFVAQLSASLGWTWDDGAVDDDSLDYVQQLGQGNGDGQAEAVWHLEDQVLPDGTSVTLDLTALEREVLGDTNTVTLLSVKAVLLSSDAASAGNLVVGGATIDPLSAPFGTATDEAVVRARWPVGAGQSGRGLAGGRQPAESPAHRQRRRRDLLGRHRGHPHRGCFRLRLGLGRLSCPTRKG